MQTKTTAEGHTTKRAEYHRVRVAAAAKRRRAEIVVLEADLTRYVQLPLYLKCHTCIKRSSPCYVERTQLRPNGDSTQKCACCTIRCQFQKMDRGCQSLLQQWLDRPQGDCQNDHTSSSTTGPPATPVPVTSTAGPRPVVATDSSTLSTMLLPHPAPSSHDPDPITSAVMTHSLMSLQPGSSASSAPVIETSLSEASDLPNNGEASKSDTRGKKRSRSETESADTSSVSRNGSTGLGNVANPAPREAAHGPAYYMLGLSAWLETISEKEHASEGALKDAEEQCKRHMATITSMKDEEVLLRAKAGQMEMERDTAQVAMQRTKTGSEAEISKLKSDNTLSRVQLRAQRLELEAAVERGKGYKEMEDERDAGRNIIAQLRLQVTEASDITIQHDAAIKNADEACKQRNELQTILTASQAENVRLSEQFTTITTEYETATIELDEYRTGFKKSQAVSAELINTKADLTILQSDYQRFLADNARLLRETGSMDEVKEKSKINQQLADDRLEERQEMEIELCQVRAEGRESETRAKKAEGKAEEIRKNWNIAKNELLAVHKSNRKLKVELKKHANCPGGEIVKRE